MQNHDIEARLRQVEVTQAASSVRSDNASKERNALRKEVSGLTIMAGDLSKRMLVMDHKIDQLLANGKEKERKPLLDKGRVAGEAGGLGVITWFIIERLLG